MISYCPYCLSSFNYTPARSEALRSWVRDFCAARRLSGVVCIDFIVDAQSGTPYAIECNPRFSSNVLNLLSNPAFGAALIRPDEVVDAVEPLAAQGETYFLFAEARRTPSPATRAASAALPLSTRPCGLAGAEALLRAPPPAGLGAALQEALLLAIRGRAPVDGGDEEGRLLRRGGSAALHRAPLCAHPRAPRAQLEHRQQVGQDRPVHWKVDGGEWRLAPPRSTRTQTPGRRAGRRVVARNSASGGCPRRDRRKSSPCPPPAPAACWLGREHRV